MPYCLQRPQHSKCAKPLYCALCLDLFLAPTYLSLPDLVKCFPLADHERQQMAYTGRKSAVYKGQYGCNMTYCLKENADDYANDLLST